MVTRLSKDRVLSLVLEGFKASGKKNLIITGSRARGKTSVFNEILKSLDSYSGLVSYRDEGLTSIKLREIGSDKTWTMANFIGGRPRPREEFFNEEGLKILEDHLARPDPIFAIDEIGKVELGQDLYLEVLARLFDQKQVIGTMRKDKNPLVGRSDFLQDTYIVDLDIINKESPD